MLFKPYTKKPITIHAVQLTTENQMDVATLIAEAGYNIKYWTKPPMRAVTGIIIETLEGNMEAGYGDWIIQGVKGEFYPCKDDIFRNNHEGFE